MYPFAKPIDMASIFDKTVNKVLDFLNSTFNVKEVLFGLRLHKGVS